jgi:hypothetical protein
MTVKRGYLLWMIVIMSVTAIASLVGAATLRGNVSAAGAGQASGVVVDGQGPVAGATVRQRATDQVTTTDGDGRFDLTSLEEGQMIELAAWADGYYVASTHVTPTVAGLTLTLRAYHTVDHPDYHWVSPIAGTSDGACGNCHPPVLSQWANNAHGTAVTNARFFSMYNGTDVGGGTAVSPGYVNDFPGTAGSCANCHAPGAGIDGYLTTDMNTVRDELTAGIHCDYCHKTGGVYLDPATGSVYANAPGAQSQRMLRPPAGDNIFFGPYDDIHDPDTYLPLIRESQYCAPCHQFSFWGTPIYESYNEWLASPYAEQGITCQNCHMRPNGDDYFALPEKGGLIHPPESIPSHLQLGARDGQFLQETVSMTVSAEQHLGRLDVTVTITNSQAGHHLPTDYPGRHMILTVAVEDGAGQPLTLLSGPVTPALGGDLAGRPGILYAKILRDVASGEQPVVSYWKQTAIASDNRIPALGASRSSYSFQLPAGASQVTVRADLILRRLFQPLADEKGWDLPDMPMAGQVLTLPVAGHFEQYVPLVVFSS